MKMMPSMMRVAVNFWFRICFRRIWSPGRSIQEVRRTIALFDRIGAIGRAVPDIEKEEIAGLQIEWIGPKSNAANGLMLYFHGGAFSVRAPLADRRFGADLFAQTGVTVALLAYRLAPEYRFPAGLDDCCRAYEILLQRGVPAARIVLLGHSAGANLALVLMMRACKRRLAQPAGAVLLAPVTDFTASGVSVEKNAPRDVFMAPDMWRWAADNYLSNEALSHPEISPLFGDWRNLPPLAFHVAECEMLLDDSVRAVARAKQCGVEAQVNIWRDVPHNFPFVDLLREARTCRTRIADFVRRCLSAS